MNTFKREACFRCYVSQFKTSITYCSHCTFKIYDMLCVFMDISQQNPCQLKCHSFNHFTEAYPTETLNATSLSVENKGSNKKMIYFQKRTPWRKDVKFQTIKTTNVTVNNVFLSSNYSYLKLHSSPNVLSERIAEIAPNTHPLYESYQTNRFHLLCITIKKI